MVRRTIFLVTLIMCMATVRGAAVSAPNIEGNLKGTELCPQSWCGAAWFWASFSGKVGHARTSGVALAGITYDFLPTDTENPGEILSGTWSLQTWRGSFSGYVSGGTLTYNEDQTYSVVMTMMLQDGAGELTFIGLLDHRPLAEGLPPTITGTIFSQ